MSNLITREEFEASEERAAEARKEIFKQLSDIKAMLLPVAPVLQLHLNDINELKKKCPFWKKWSGVRSEQLPLLSSISALLSKL